MLATKGFQDYEWCFSKLPYTQHDGQVVEGSIELNDFELVDVDGKSKSIGLKDVSASALSAAMKAIESLNVVPLAKHENYTTYDTQGYPIDYACFRAPGVSTFAPTVFLIEGGPEVFINYRDHAHEINFFNEHGYHVVIPQGLFRKGYGPMHVQKSQGQFGEMDIEHLRCVLRDLKTQSISNDPVHVMGHSYGGFCGARLSYDLEGLVKCAYVGNAFLDLTKFVSAENKKYLTHKTGEDDSLWHHRMSTLSPAITAPLSTVPILMQGTQNDVRCSIEHSRMFADRLKLQGTPFVYLEHYSGGHQRVLPLQTILDFFQGKTGDTVLSEGYNLQFDNMSFFK